MFHLQRSYIFVELSIYWCCIIFTSRGHKSAVAVKIVKGIDRYTDAAKIEVKILEKLKDHDPYDER